MSRTKTNCPGRNRDRDKTPLIYRGVCPDALEGMTKGEEVQRILLSKKASDYLDSLEDPCFAVVSFDRSDDRSGRWVIHLTPCTHEQANSAVRVARGQSKERRPTKAPRGPSKPSANNQ